MTNENAAMNSTTAPRTALALPAGTPAAARTALKLLQRLQHGHLTVQLPDGTLQHFGHGDGPSAAITLKNWNVSVVSGLFDAEGRQRQY